MKNKGKILMSVICSALTVLLIILLRFVDVREIGPKGTSIGLSHLNQFFFNLTGVNMVWYDITDWLGLTAVATALIFAVIGLVQLIKRKSFIKVDKEILALGGLYLFVIGIYLLFENMIVNYRPVIMPGSDFPGASFPSSHTMIVCIIMGSAVMVIVITYYDCLYHYGQCRDGNEKVYQEKSTAKNSYSTLLCHNSGYDYRKADIRCALVHGYYWRNIDKRIIIDSVFFNHKQRRR